MLSLLISLLPQEAWILVLVTAGFLIIFGARRLGVSLIATIFLMAMLFPFIGALFSALPAGIMVLLFLCFVFYMARLLLGKHIIEGILSNFIYDLLKLPFRFLAWLFRGFRRH